MRRYLTYVSHKGEKLGGVTILVKTKVKTYPDGTQKIYVYKEPYIKGEAIEEEKPKGSGGTLTEEEQRNKEYQNLRRTKNAIQDYVLSNTFDYFITFTFKEDRHNDEKAFKQLENWLKYQKQKYGKFNYIMIPERHKDGAIHFHGVIGDYKGKIEDSGVKHKNQKVYNFIEWRYGYSTATKINTKNKVASYVTKYITKDMDKIVKKGKKKYWRSHGLQKPVESYYELDIYKDIVPDFENKNMKIYNIKKNQENPCD